METKKLKIKFLKEYEELFNPKWRYIVYYGGRYGAKSYHTALAFLIQGCGARLRMLCTREIQNTIKDSVHKLLSDLVQKYEIPSYRITEDTIKNQRTGSEFIFKGLHGNKDGIKSFEGIDKVWIEEGQSVSDESLDILIPTIRKPGSQIVVTFNRMKKNDPVFERFIKSPPPRTYSAFYNYNILEGTGLLSDEIKTEIDHCKENKPELFKHIYLGEPRRLSETLIIRTEWFKYFQKEPVFEYRFLTGDTAQKTKEANDYSVFACWGVTMEKRLHLIDLIRGKWEAPELEKQAASFWNKHVANKNGFLRTFYIEDKASGTGLIQSIQRKGSVSIEAVQRNKDKYTRCLDVLGYIKSGYVFLPEDAWFLSDFLTECEGFTSNDQHEYDDQVDNLLDACDKTFGIGVNEAGIALG
ncbi:MAG TPA: PBSX family phage terminase large subunit [Ignavibacteriales bacterium]|nr:PBSX family phage terminase large subunit [Ignavibacteriales bacterium]